MAMTQTQLDADNYNANVHQIAPSYDANVYYSISVLGDRIECGKCGRVFRSFETDYNRRAHATPVRNPNSLDIACPMATWAGAMATHAIWN